MEPRIQYAQTADGVSIAFWTLGEGMPLVCMPSGPWSHIQLEWQDSRLRRWSERLAERRKVVRYDGRGSGLSDRDVTDYSLDGLLLDLEGVVDRLSLGRFALFGFLHAGPVAIAYAARHPERLSHLVLWCTYARASDLGADPRVQGLEALAEKDWRLFTDAVTHVLLGWSGGERARRMAAAFRAMTTQEAYLAAMRSGSEFDVTALLPQVRSPTLVLHRRQLPWPEVGLARGVASRIPDARLTVFEGASVMPGVGDVEAVLRAIDEFLGEGDEAAPAQAGMLPEGMAVILFTDIAGSTALTEQLGDAAFRAKARKLDERLRSVIREADGTAVEGKVLGDGVMAVFTSARQAIDGAIRCNAAAQDTGLELHLGVHAGDVIREGNTVYGGAVNIAARIAGASAPGEIMVSDTVRSLARTSADVAFDDRGERTLKGVGEPVRLYEVRWREESGG